MANRFARKTGNWNASDVWSDTAAGAAGAQFIPVAGDVAMANSFIVTVNVNAECAEVRTDTTGGATTGGRFTLADGVTLTANCYAGSSICVYYAGSASAAVVGNITGGSSNGHGASNTGPGTLSITGNIVGGASAQGVNNGNVGIVSIIGNVTGSSAGSFCGAYNASTGTITISGNATGGAGSNAYGASNASTGTMRVGRAIGNDHGPGYATNNGNPGVFGYGTNSGGQPTTTVGGITFGAYGQAPVAGRVLVDPSLLSSLTAILIRETTLAQIVCTGPDNTSADPAEANVRYGTSYRFGAKTGTCRVPGASSVLTGVLVDNTTGTATIGAADIRAAVGLASANLDTQLAAILAGGGGGEIDPADIRSAIGLASANLDTQMLNLRDQVEYNRGHHTVAGNTFYVDGVGGNDTTGTGTRLLPYKTITKALTACVANTHDQILLLPNASGGPTQITEAGTITVNKSYVQIRGPGRDVEVRRSTNGKVFNITASGVELSGFRVTTTGGGSSDAVEISGAVDFVRLHRLWIESAHRDAVFINVANRCEIQHCTIVAPTRDGVRVGSGAGNGSYNSILDCVIRDAVGSAVNLQGSDASDCRIQRNVLRDNVVGITISSGVTDTVVTDNRMVNNTTALSDAGTRTLQAWNFLGTDTAGALTALATDVVNSAALAASAVTEMQSGLATTASINALHNLSAQQVWEYVARTLTAGGGGGLDANGVRAAVGLASANLDTQLSAISTDVLTIPTTPLLDANYIAPPSVSDIRDELDANSTKLAHLDADISSRASANDSVSSDTFEQSLWELYLDTRNIVDRTVLGLLRFEGHSITKGGITSGQLDYATDRDMGCVVLSPTNYGLEIAFIFRFENEIVPESLIIFGFWSGEYSWCDVYANGVLVSNPDTRMNDSDAIVSYTYDISSIQLDENLGIQVSLISQSSDSNHELTLDSVQIRARNNGVLLRPEYDAAKIAASQASVTAIPTTPLLAENYTAPDNAGIAAVGSAVSALHDFDPAHDTVAHVALVDTVTTLTSGGGGGDPTEIADAVRDELAPELASITAMEERLAEQVPEGPVGAVPGAAAGQTTAWAMCYDATGAPEEGVEVSIKIVSATGAGGAAYDSVIASGESNVDGLVQIPIPRGAGLLFAARRGAVGRWIWFRGVDADTLALPRMIGSP